VARPTPLHASGKASSLSAILTSSLAAAVD
jgi:hypothetical protein